MACGWRGAGSGQFRSMQGSAFDHSFGKLLFVGLSVGAFSAGAALVFSSEEDFDVSAGMAS